MNEESVGIYDLFYYYTKEEKKKIDGFCEVFLNQLSQSLVFPIFSQAVYDACELSMLGDAGEGVRYFLANSNVLRLFFFELVALRIVKPSESVDIGEILKHIPTDVDVIKIREDDEFSEFNNIIHAMIYGGNFHICQEIAKIFKFSYDAKISKSVDPVKCLVYFVKMRKEKLFEKFQMSLIETGFKKEEASRVIEKVREFFNGRRK